MKKLILGVLFLVGASVCRADDTGFIEETLIGHVSTVSQFKSGETKLALMDSVILIGNYKGRSIFDLQLGLSAETTPDSGETSGGNFIYGGLFKVSSLLKDIIKFPPHWQFLNSIEHGVSYVYDSREKRDYLSYQVGLAFSLNPKP